MWHHPLWQRRELSGLVSCGRLLAPLKLDGIGPEGATGCSHGWSATRRKPGEAESVEWNVQTLSPPRKGRRCADTLDTSIQTLRPFRGDEDNRSQTPRVTVVRSWRTRFTRGYNPTPRRGLSCISHIATSVHGVALVGSACTVCAGDKPDVTF